MHYMRRDPPSAMVQGKEAFVCGRLIYIYILYIYIYIYIYVYVYV